MTDNFYWRNNRDSVITPTAIRMFQILSQYDGKEFDKVKLEIDEAYSTAVGRDDPKRHGGIIQTQIRAFQEAGWVELDEGNIRITDAGRQALVLLSKLPDFLKVVPYFVIELLTRYQINNPARPDSSKNPEYDALLKECDIFPYWTLYKIMRESDLYITADELKRFVFKIQKSEEIPLIIDTIKKYREDKESGLSVEDLDKKYPPMLTGAISEPKYVMGRLGTQVGRYPPVIKKEARDKWVINRSYLSFIDEVIKNEPIFKEHLTEKSWLAEHGKFIPFPDEIIPPLSEDDIEDETVLSDDLPDEDSVWKQTKDLLDHGACGIIFSGPPGTSKTWYASKIAIKLTNGKARCIKQIQFHPSFNYDDFVEGYVPGVSSTEALTKTELFKVVDKVFLKAAEAARKHPNDLYVLVIDEFTRGDPSRIFGEVLTYLEKDYRNKNFILPYSGKPRSIPSNIVILGTMNPYDKSVADLDAAIDRRFEIVQLDPDINILKKLTSDAGMRTELMGKVIEFFNDANKKCPHGFGHTYFLGIKDEKDLLRLWNHKLKFLFEKAFRFEPQTLEDIKEAYKKLVTAPEKLAK